MKPTVFIHTNAQQLLGAKISAYSLQRASANSDKFDVQIIKLENIRTCTTATARRFCATAKKRFTAAMSCNRLRCCASCRLR